MGPYPRALSSVHLVPRVRIWDSRVVPAITLLGESRSEFDSREDTFGTTPISTTRHDELPLHFRYIWYQSRVTATGEKLFFCPFGNDVIITNPLFSFSCVFARNQMMKNDDAWCQLSDGEPVT